MKKWLSICAVVAAMALEFGCGLNGPSGPVDNGGGGGGGGTTGTTINGVATKGPLNGATVTVYEVTDSSGANGSSIGTATTDASGKFSVTTSKVPSGPIRVSVSGGSFLSDVDGKTSITNSATLTALITDSTKIPNPVNVTVATSMLDTMAQGFAGGKTPGGQLAKRGGNVTKLAGTSCSGGVTAGMGCATTSLGGFYGGIPSTGGTGFGGTPTVTSATDIDAFKIGLLSGAVEVCANKAYPTNPGAFFTAIFADATDLIFDGKNAGADIFLDPPTNSLKLSSTALTTDFLLCLNEYVSTSTVLSVTGGDLDSAVNSISGGVSQSPLTPKALGLSAGSSGAIATLAFQGKQYLFVAARSAGVVVIDITDPTNASPAIKVWPGVNGVLGNDVGGVIPIIGRADHGQVVAFSYGSQQMALLNADLMVNGDPTKSADESAIIDAHFAPTFVSTSPADVSGGSGFVLGGTPDPGRHGVWMSTVDGYKLLDISLTAPDFDAGNSYDAFPQPGGAKYPDPTQVAENMGADISHNQLFVGNYYGVQVVDLAGKASYLLDDTNWAMLAAVRSSYTIDGDSVDNALQVGVLTFEDTSDVAFLNLAGITTTPGASGAPGTFSPAAGGLVVLDTSMGGTIPYHTYSGSAVDSTTHYGLLMAGFSTDMGVFQIQDPASVASGGTWAGASNYSMFNLATGGIGYSEAYDPHAVGAIFNIGNSKAYGYLLDGSNLRVLQVDLTGFLAATQDATGHQPATDPTSAGGTITHFDWTIPTITGTRKSQPVKREQHIPPAH
ncbi:hypothetical protein Acid345_1497 [Candidatus Koribacter versatilis Ellin345]|uniref:Uncharacterized protein n=1 Tax=Koribacter versatilis (strain Ellin345) TaxID=204669 RepID=Q1IRK1_KORVE|nr:carboxypeptidase regulatory-like domain-containing protein [Candidatus Koribacter versatilis]ABF40499.1 hypothetical protein Acid345_1497 [Candidatus Koribacter versatilis Ellin345]